jgi:hypothetical protein
MTVDRSKLAFYSGDNTMKEALNDSITLSIGDTFNDDTFSYDVVTKLLVSHNLGYIPRARVWYEPISGQLWPMTGLEQFQNFGGGVGTELDIVGTPHLTTTGLYVNVKNDSGSAMSVTFHYRIYYDE